MPVVVPVKFAFAAHELWFDHATRTSSLAITPSAPERGTEIGLVTADPFECIPELAAPPARQALPPTPTSIALTTWPTPRGRHVRSAVWWRRTVWT
ncbi:MAG: hypothetical protein ACLTKG_03790 [Collinsella intestinalis]